MNWNWWSKKEHSSLHRSCHQWVRDTGYSPGAQEIEHKSVSPPDGSSSALPVSEGAREVRHQETHRWETSLGSMKTDRGKSKVNLTTKYFINFGHIITAVTQKEIIFGLYLQPYKNLWTKEWPLKKRRLFLLFIPLGWENSISNGNAAAKHVIVYSLALKNGSISADILIVHVALSFISFFKICFSWLHIPKLLFVFCPVVFIEHLYQLNYLFDFFVCLFCFRGCYNVLHSVHCNCAHNCRIYLGSVCLFVSKKSQRPHLTVEFEPAIEVFLQPWPQQNWILPPQWLWTPKQPEPGQSHLPATSFPRTSKFLSKKIKLQGFHFPSLSAKSPTSGGNWQSADDSTCFQYGSRHQHFTQSGPSWFPLVQSQSPSGLFHTASTCLWVNYKGIPRFLSRVLLFLICFFLYLSFTDTKLQIG